MGQVDRQAVIAVDVDGPTISTVAISNGVHRAWLDCCEAMEIGNATHGLAWYEIAEGRFLVRPWAPGGHDQMAETIGAFRIRVADAMRRASAGAAGRDRHLAVSMPAQTFFDANGDASPAVGTLQQKLSEAVHYRPSNEICFANVVLVLPRVVGAFLDWSLDWDGSPIAHEAERVFLVDVGFTTCTAVAFDVKRQEISTDQPILSYPCGIELALASLAARIESEHAVGTLSWRSLLRIATSGRYRLRGVDADAVLVLSDAMEGVAKWVGETYAGHPHHGRIVLTGVGAVYAHTALKRRSPEIDVDVVPDGMHANARGMAKFALLAAAEAA